MKKYIISGLGEPFDGLVVHVDEGQQKLYSTTARFALPVSRIEQRHVLFDSFSIPVKNGCLFLASECLVPYRDTVVEQLTDNPYGDFLYEGSVTRGSVKVSWNFFTNCCAVTVKNHDNTLYSHQFMGDVRHSAIDLLTEIQSTDEEFDLDDVVFRLQEIE